MDPKFSQSLDRGLAILASFTPERNTIGTAELADDLRISRSTAHRYVMTLVELGYLEPLGQAKYRLTLRVTKLGMSAMSSTSTREHSSLYLKQLSRETKLTASLAVLDGPEIVYQERMRGLRPAGLDTRVNARLPAYCTAAGKILLAHLPVEEQSHLLNAIRFAKRAPNTITDAEKLQAELEQAREKGLAFDEQELAPGVLGLATPLRMGNGEVLAAIDLVASSTAIDLDELINSFSPSLLAAASRVSARLGYRRQP